MTRGLSCLLAGLLVVMLFATAIAWEYASMIDTTLGISSGGDLSMNPTDYTYLSDYENAAQLMAAHRVLGERVEEEGAVLLKNNSGLPLNDDNLKVTLFGMKSRSPYYGATMGCIIAGQNCVRPDKAFNQRGFTCNPDMVSFYDGLKTAYKPSTESNTVNEVPISEYAGAPVSSFKDYSDAAIIFLGRPAGEGMDYAAGAAGIANPDEFKNSITGNILGLSDDERDLVDYVKQQDFEKIVVLLNTCNAMEIAELENDDAIDAILWIGFTGAYGYFGVADLLTGAAVPSGHVTDTYAVNGATTPAMQNYGVYTYDGAGGSYVIEAEGIYVGYKYYETRYYDSIANPGWQAATGWDYDSEVVYPFGHGLSYTSFDEEIVSADINPDGVSTFTIRVTNTGSVAAKHAVQLYVSVPYTAGQVEKSAIQLVGYAKTGEAAESSMNDVVLLQPGESEELTITVDAVSYESYDEATEHDGVFGAYVLDAGTYWFALGENAHDAVNNVLIAQGNLEGAASRKTASGVLTQKAVITKSKSGALIQNQIQTADINHYLPGTVSYLTRTAWSDTFPAAVKGVKANAAILADLATDTYEIRTGDDTSDIIFNAGTGIKAYQLKGITDYNDPLYEQVINELSFDTIVTQLLNGTTQLDAMDAIGSPIAPNIDSPVGLQSSVGKQAGGIYTVSSDEDGSGQPVYDQPLPMLTSASFGHHLAEEVGKLLGEDGLWTGIRWWFGVGANLHRTQYNGRNGEYYSEDAYMTGTTALDVIMGARSRGLVSSTKHFAFNEQEAGRMGISTYLTEQAARENSLRAFQLFLEGGSESAATGFMTAYNRCGPIYCAMNAGLINGIVRGEWDFKGVIITDFGSSSTANENVVVGTDVMLTTNPWGYTADQLQNDRTLVLAYREAMHHVLYAFANSAWLDGITETTSVSGTSWWKTAFVALDAVLGAATLVAVAGAIYGSVTVKKKEEN